MIKVGVQNQEGSSHNMGKMKEPSLQQIGQTNNLVIHNEVKVFLDANFIHQQVIKEIQGDF